MPKNLLTRAQLDAGIDRLQQVLQGKFSGAFVSAVAEALKGCSRDEWDACVQALSWGRKKPLDLTVADFLEALDDVRREASRRAAVWACRPEGRWKPDWKELAARAESDPGTSALSREILRRLARRAKGASGEEPVRGGEKYRNPGA